MNFSWKEQNGQIWFFINSDLNLKFRLPKKIIPFLIINVPKIYLLKIKINQNFYQINIDLSGLYVPKEDKQSLKIVLRKDKDPKNPYPEKGFAILRSESYKERYLSPQGWQQTEYFFPIYEENANVKTIEKKEFIPQKKSVETHSSKFKECPFCGKILKWDFDYCPYCKNYIGKKDTSAQINL